MDWPESPEALVTLQEALAAARPEPWKLTQKPVALGGCFVCFSRGASGPGAAGDGGWAGASLAVTAHSPVTAAIEGQAGAPYEPGRLAMREGRLLEAAVRELPRLPEVLLVNATGRDHPRRAGLALHLGAVLGIPTVGVTHRPLCAVGQWPGTWRGAAAPLLLGGEVVGFWLRTKTACRPLAVHGAWRTDPLTAVEVVLAALGLARTPEPLMLARRAARAARAQGVSQR